MANVCRNFRRSGGGIQPVDCENVRGRVSQGGASLRPDIPVNRPSSVIPAVPSPAAPFNAAAQATGSSPGNVGLNNVNRPSLVSAAPRTAKVAKGGECHKAGQNCIGPNLTQACPSSPSDDMAKAVRAPERPVIKSLGRSPLPAYECFRRECVIYTAPAFAPASSAVCEGFRERYGFITWRFRASFGQEIPSCPRSKFVSMCLYRR